MKLLSDIKFESDEFDSAGEAKDAAEELAGTATLVDECLIGR